MMFVNTLRETTAGPASSSALPASGETLLSNDLHLSFACEEVSHSSQLYRPEGVTDFRL